MLLNCLWSFLFINEIYLVVAYGFFNISVQERNKSNYCSGIYNLSIQNCNICS